MEKYGADNVILELYYCIKDTQQIFEDKAHQQKKLQECLKEFETLLKKFLQDDTSSKNHDSPKASDNTKRRATGGGIKDLGLALDDVVTTGDIQKEKLLILSNSKISSAVNLGFGSSSFAGPTVTGNLVPVLGNERRRVPFGEGSVAFTATPATVAPI